MPHPTSTIDMGSEKMEYLSQTHRDYLWPSEKGKQDSAEVAKTVGRSSFVPGYDRASYMSETMERYSKPSLDAKPAVAHQVSRALLEFGTDVPTFATTHSEGFPRREIDLSGLSQNKEATLEVNRAHFVFGNEGRNYDTTYREAIRKTQIAAEDPASSKAAGRPARSGGEGYVGGLFGSEATSYETTNRMPLYDITYQKGKPFDPTSHSGISATPGAAAVVASLTTSGKPLSAVAFGYDKPKFATETMERTGAADISLKAPYKPKLTPRYIKDHPALRASE